MSYLNIFLPALELKSVVLYKSFLSCPAMNTIKQRAVKGAVGWPSASEIIVAKSLLWWIWEVVVHRRSASPNVYPTLMPPENSKHVNVCFQHN